MSLGPPPYKDPVDQNGSGLSWSWLRWLQALYSSLTGLLGSLGGQYINVPYGQFQSRVTQTIATANTPQQVALATTAYSNGITLAANKMTVAQAGTYSFSFQLQVANPDAAIQEMYVWLRKNGTDVAYSADKFSLTTKHGAVDGYTVAESTFFVSMSANDYAELYMAATLNTINIETYAANAPGFTVPGVPSADVNVLFIST